jgi:D-tyrosyl-tRNA(Tyr) deacylase
MRAVIQRVSRGSVKIGEDYYREIGSGMVVLLGVHKDDTEADAKKLADKICNLRIFNDDNDKLNLSINDVNGEMLIISQFTLYGDCKKGNRPSFIDSANAEKGNQLYEIFVEECKQLLGEERVKTGIFGAMMTVEIINEGPVTIIVHTDYNKILSEK